MFSCGSALGCHAMVNQEGRIFASPISLPVFFFCLSEFDIYRTFAKMQKKKKNETRSTRTMLQFKG